MYFLSPYKVHLFGFQNEATREQINYVIGENELLDKGSNGTLSLVINGIIKFKRREEKHLKLTCDNAVGQNKNNTTLWLCFYLVITSFYESVELNFMVVGHTKFQCDSNFGMIKKLYRNSTITCIDDFVKVVKKSSPQGLNKTQCYEKGEGFQYRDIKGTLEKYFIKLPNLAKYHHFYFSVDKPGVVKVQEEANGEFKEFNLWKDKSRVAENVEEIKKLPFPILTPPPLKFERQVYLYEKIRPLVKEECRDIICPKPINISSPE